MWKFLFTNKTGRIIGLMALCLVAGMIIGYGSRFLFPVIVVVALIVFAKLHNVFTPKNKSMKHPSVMTDQELKREYMETEKCFFHYGYDCIHYSLLSMEKEAKHRGISL